jgi:arylsulfatase A-like enzyme
MDRFPAEYFENNTHWKDDFINGEAYQNTLRSYYAMVNSIDEQFGRINTLLKELGIDDNTIVVFTSDHGEMFASQGRMYKLTFYDEAARIPLLIKYPGQPAITKSDVCINTPDLLPTMLGMMNLSAEITDDIEGTDFTKVLNGKNKEEPKVALLQGMGHTWRWIDGFEWRAVRGKRFTYAKYLRDGTERLFDRKVDPFQITNVIDAPEYADDLKRLRSLMHAKMNSLKDEFKPCTWYRDNWMHNNYSIKAGAKGDFAPLPPIQVKRTLN